MEPVIQILLATYNGAEYIDMQLESLLAQTFDDFEILVSDDSSTDGTLEIVRRYALADSRVRVLEAIGSHGGARDNFLWLISQATAPHVAFCDQDDLWLPDKLAKELEYMRELEATYGADTSLLVFSDLAVADETLDVISPSFMAYAGLDPQRVSLANLLAQNVAPGCVQFVNRALYRDALRLPENRASVAMHDWWLMLTAATLGHIGYVDQPTMLYRQHGDNSVGAEEASAAGIVSRLGEFADCLLPSDAQLSGVDLRLAQAGAFARTYGDVLNADDLKLCEGFATLLEKSPLERLRWCREHDVRNATILMQLGLSWELLFYDRARSRSDRCGARDEIAPQASEQASGLDAGDLFDAPASFSASSRALQASVAVVMSTYNGEHYLSEQIDSVLAQDAPNVHLFVRDDGSTDGTVPLLRTYASRGQLTLLEGSNLGVVGSFFDALAMVPPTYEFVAFCDQDDVWHPDKVSRALAALVPKNQSVPQLYCSEYDFCDEQLDHAERSHLNRIGVGFSTLMAESVCSGNTMLMNRALVDELLANGPEGVYTHDWWCALVAAGLGEISFDAFSSLDYRRIASSVSPTGSSGLSLLLFRLRTFLGKGELSRITEMLRHYRDLYSSRLRPDDLALLDRMLDGNRLAKAFTPTRLRQKLPDELAVRLLYLAGLL